MKKRLIDILPKISQWESIEYADDFNCPHCDKSGLFDGYGEERVRPNLVGWCETFIGYMGVFECPICFEKYRFHCTIGTWVADVELFETYLYYTATDCKNWADIKNKLEE